jgi:diguanylate cyclase (GGDEF)-like protein
MGMKGMWIDKPLLLNLLLLMSYMGQDILILLAAATFGFVIAKLYAAYDRPRALLVLMFGLGFFTIGNILDILFLANLLSGVWLLAIEDVSIATAIILSVSSLMAILPYLLEAAKVDPLTDLYNRRSFREALNAELARSLRGKLSFSIIFCDIDNFKLINDEMGHANGDMVLRHVAQKLNNNVRASDTVARWGGDEFVILLPQTCLNDAQNLVERLNQEINSMIPGKIRLSFSYGLAVFPDDGDKAEQLLNAADIRMYNSKKQECEDSL